VRASSSAGKVRITRRIELATRVVRPAQAGDARALVLAWQNKAGRELILRPGN
jgi:hypothetical protein